MPSTPFTLSLLAAAALTGKSKRTLWRRLSGGALQRGQDDTQGRATLLVEQLQAEGWPELSPEDWADAVRADAGDAVAACELALKLLAHGREIPARHWLEQASDLGHADAMHWLALILLRSATPDLPGAMVWLARAAAAGHPVAQAQLASWQPGTPRT
jgi:uncharacterized protein